MRRFWYTVKPLVLAVMAFGVYVWAVVKWDILGVRRGDGQYRAGGRRGVAAAALAGVAE